MLVEPAESASFARSSLVGSPLWRVTRRSDVGATDTLPPEKSARSFPTVLLSSDNDGPDTVATIWLAEFGGSNPAGTAAVRVAVPAICGSKAAVLARDAPPDMTT